MSMSEQRRLVTVVFADVVGSTALAEELDAEDVRALFTRYYALANEVIVAHGGIVAKLLGDGVLAVFGVPVAHGDDAQRAIDAALRLRDAVSRDTALQRLQLRIGVNTGEVLANEDASGEIVGDAVNVAARVAAAAGEGEILAADVTHRAATAIAYGEARDISAKGKSQPVRVWPATAHTEATGATTPFVGRADDLAQLELVARRAFHDRHPHLVTVTAPAGTGKTRLARELRTGLPAGSRYAHAQCPPYGQTLAFAPLRELLVGALDLSSDVPPDDLRRQVGAVLDGPEAVRDAILVAQTVAPEASPDDLDRDRVVAAWRRLFVRLSADSPLLVVIEDLHNAADSLLDLVEQIAQPTVDAAIVVLCLARPELLQRRPAWGGGARNSLNLALGPLTDTDIAALVANLLEVEPPPSLRDLVVERAAGNPFFAEELVRALLDRGPIDLSDAGAVARALRALPETVQATLLARIDMLPPEERGVLQAAAVVGRTFDQSTLRVVSELPGSAIDGALARLVERELVSKVGELAYGFRNALVRDVAYGMLPRARRSRDHARIAQRLQATAGERVEELAGLIGAHYLEATRLRRASAVPVAIEGADDETTRSGAVRWLARAARSNAAASAWQEALQQLQDAIAIATDPEKIVLLTQLGEISGGGDIGFDALIEARRLWHAAPDADPTLGARIASSTLITLYRAGISISPGRRLDQAAQLRLAEEALELARRSPDETVLGAALLTHAYLARSLPDRTRASLESGRDEAARAAAILDRREPTLWSIALDAWSAAVGDLGDVRGAREIAARRVARLEALPSFERAHAQWTMPLYDMALGDIAGSLGFVEAALAEPAFVNSRWALNSAIGNIFLLSWRAAVLWALGRWDDVLADARAAVTIARALPDDEMRSLYDHASTAALYVARRREQPDVVAELAPILRRWVQGERALTVLEDDPAHLDGILGRVADAGIDTWQVERSLSLAAAYGRVPSEPERLDALVTDAATRGLRPLEAQLRRLRARSRRDPADARSAHSLLRDCGMTADASLAAVELAALGDRSLLAEARAELERLGDQRGLAAVKALG